MRQPSIAQLAATAKEHGAEAAILIVVDPRTGEAMGASWGADDYLCYRVGQQLDAALARLDAGDLKLSHRKIHAPPDASRMLFAPAKKDVKPRSNVVAPPNPRVIVQTLEGRVAPQMTTAERPKGEPR